MDNVKFSVNGNKLTITVDITAAGEASKTGKTKLVASTHGAVPVECSRAGLKVALNVMVPNGH
jgi:CTP:molybdopterin cytidylyltransferase MocA